MQILFRGEYCCDRKVEGLFLFCDDCQIFFEGGNHRGGLRKGGLYIEGKAGFFDGFGSIAAEGADFGAILFEFGVIVEKAFHAAGSEEADDIVFTLIEDRFNIIADGAVHEWGCKAAVV